MSITAGIHAEYSLNDGQTWWTVALFEIGSGRRLALALHAAGLGDRGLPPNTSEPLRDRYDEQHAACPEEIFGATGLSSAEFLRLMDPALWLSAAEKERVAPHAYEGYAETDAVAAWAAFAQVHETHGHPVRLVIWFAL